MFIFRLYDYIHYIKQNNSSYLDIALVLGNMPENLFSLSKNDIEKSETEDTLEEDGNPLDLHRFNLQEIIFYLIFWL